MTKPLSKEYKNGYNSGYNAAKKKKTVILREDQRESVE